MRPSSCPSPRTSLPAEPLFQPHEVDPEVDREAPTPRISGSFSTFRDLAMGVAQRTSERRAALAARRTVLSAALLAELDAMTERAEGLALEFGQWPERPPDVISRTGTIRRLMNLREQVRSYLDGER